MLKVVPFIDLPLTMKKEHCQLSQSHQCSDSIPELNKMVFAVQAMGKFSSTLKCNCCLTSCILTVYSIQAAVAQRNDLRLKFSEEQAKRKMLYNQIQEAKGIIFSCEA